MKINNQKTIVIFGAGKIGRSFIGQLFSRGGYEVVFIDVYKPIIDELNRRGNYNVVIKAEKEQIINISNVRGVLSKDEDKVIEEISKASIMAVCVGLNALSMVVPLIARGLIRRLELNSQNALDIILAENMRDAAIYFKEKLEAILPQDYPFDRLVGLVETSIGKMVPIMRQKDVEEDMLQVFAEPYNTLILDGKAFRNPIPHIDGLAPKENMKAWVDRKLFIHNLGHATTAYLGYLYDARFVFLYEALAVPQLYNRVRDTMLQASDILLKKYPDEFTPGILVAHIDDLLSRFRSIHLGDTIFRVGCDLNRKLGVQDRLAGALHLALGMQLPYDKILFALVCGYRFKATDEDGKMFSGDESFHLKYDLNLKSLLINVCGFNELTDSELINEAHRMDQRLDHYSFREEL